MLSFESHQIESLKSKYINRYIIEVSMILALWHFEIFKYRILLFFVFFLFYIHYTSLVFANYQQVSLPDSNYISPLQSRQIAEDTTCHYSPDLLDIEIGKVNLSTQEEDIFQFYVRMSDLQIDPGDLSYTWVVESPPDSIVPAQPILDYRVTLRPDQWGTYRITLALEDSFQNCKYTVYVFQYPEMEHDDFEFIPSIHALFWDTWMF